MTPNSGKTFLIVSFFTSIAIITWQERKNASWWGGAHPKRYIGACVAYGMLGIAEPIISPQLAGILGIGLAMGLTMKGKLTGIAWGMPSDRFGGQDSSPPQSKPRGTNAGLTNLGASIRAAVNGGAR